MDLSLDAENDQLSYRDVYRRTGVTREQPDMLDIPFEGVALTEERDTADPAYAGSEEGVEEREDGGVANDEQESEDVRQSNASISQQDAAD